MEDVCLETMSLNVSLPIPCRALFRRHVHVGSSKRQMVLRTDETGTVGERYG